MTTYYTILYNIFTMKGRDFRKLISLAFFVVLVVIASAVCFADTPPSVADEVACPIYVNGSKISDTGYTIKGNLYISIDTLRKYGDTTGITFDTSEGKAYFNSSDMDMFFGNEETTTFIKKNAGRVYLPIKYFKGANQISLGSVSQLCKISYNYSNGSIYLYPYKDIAQLWVAGSNSAAVSMSAKKIGSQLTLENGSKVTVVSESTSLLKVRDLFGKEYYVNKADFLKQSGATVKRYIQNSRAKDTFKTQINLAWLTAGARTALAPAKNDGIDVMSPVWLRLETDGSGVIRNNCEHGFVELCHANDAKVWICVNNNFDESGSTASTTTVLKNTTLRNKAIAQYLLYTCLYDADGINVDFEGMEKSIINEYYTAFVTELAKHCSKLGLTISLATPAASTYWQRYFDFPALGKVVDYICPMTYEEHYSRAVGAGSTMSPSWYTSTTNALIDLIGANKVLMGVPFFTQEWVFDSAGNIIDLTAVTMKSSIKELKELGVTPVWSEEEGQYIATYKNSDGNTVKIWVEDKRSMAFKLNYVKSSGIAGTACWAYAQHTDDIFDVFADVYKRGVDPLSIPGYW